MAALLRLGRRDIGSRSLSSSDFNHRGSLVAELVVFELEDGVGEQTRFEDELRPIDIPRYDIQVFAPRV